jgi:hypothetical protein
VFVSPVILLRKVDWYSDGSADNAPSMSTSVCPESLIPSGLGAGVSLADAWTTFEDLSSGGIGGVGSFAGAFATTVGKVVEVAAKLPGAVLAVGRVAKSGLGVFANESFCRSRGRVTREGFSGLALLRELIDGDWYAGAILVSRSVGLLGCSQSSSRERPSFANPKSDWEFGRLHQFWQPAILMQSNAKRIATTFKGLRLIIDILIMNLMEQTLR